MKPSSIRNRMEKLKNMRNLDIQPDTHYSIVTIINWELYQSNEKKEDTQEDRHRTTKGQPKDTDKNDKNDKKEKKINKRKDFISPYLGEFKNVKLTSEELAKLELKFLDAVDRIENLSVYIQSKGDKYKDHYATILNWDRMAKKKEGKTVKPTTYAQAQDLERRGRAKWLKEMEDDNQGSSDQGTGKAITLLPGDQV